MRLRGVSVGDENLSFKEQKRLMRRKRYVDSPIGTAIETAGRRTAEAATRRRKPALTVFGARKVKVRPHTDPGEAARDLEELFFGPRRRGQPSRGRRRS